MNVDILVERFRQHYGHIDFRDNRFTPDEHTYKLNRGREMLEWFSHETLRKLIETENWSEICERVSKSFSMGGPLARWDEYQWVRELDGEEQHRFSLAFEAFLYGDEPFLDRLDAFVTQATDVYRQLRNRDPKNAKKYKRNSLTWPFVSYFHFMMWPDQKYVFVKPTPLRNASRAVGFDLQYHSRPNRDTYASVQEFYLQLWPTVENYGGRDWIDVQTLIHVAGGGFNIPKGGWVDDPQPEPEDEVDDEPEDDPWAEQIAEWQADHLPLERIKARQDAEQKARTLLEENIGRFDIETLDEFLALLNVDHRDGRTRKDRFGQAFGGANRNQIVAHLANFNRWSTQLWEASEMDLSDILSEFWQQMVVPGAGGSLPTMILYLRDPARYNVWFRALTPGLERISGVSLEGGRSGSAYRQYNDSTNTMRVRYDLQPQEVDVILTLASRLEQPDGGEGRLEGPPPAPDLAKILNWKAESPYVFSDGIVTNYHLSLLTKPFVILTGLSGTGKTKLTRLYADAVYGIQNEGHNRYYAIVAVRPDWTDGRGLLGYYNPLIHTYEATPFLQFMLRAAADPAHWYYLCLDEMNLARVEYYFSDFLSAMESQAPVSLHGFTGQCVATKTGVAELLPEGELVGGKYTVDGVLYIPSSLRIPSNLAISGTVNVDETTHAFSDKVLDRANSIEFNRADLTLFAERYRERYAERAALVDDVMPLLHEVYRLLEPRYLHFGYRTLEEVLEYLWQNEGLPQDVSRDKDEVLDNQLMQKVLPKVRGDERIGETLEKLRDVLKNALGEESTSVSTLNWMIEELSAFGSTQFWR